MIFNLQFNARQVRTFGLTIQYGQRLKTAANMGLWQVGLTEVIGLCNLIYLLFRLTETN